jgi:hypothetical protein
VFAYSLLHVYCLLVFLFDSEDGGSMFLLNVMKRLPEYAALFFFVFILHLVKLGSYAL